MSRSTGDIVNLINGVSQQAPALRLPTQGEEQIGFYSTIVEGLKKRPPTEFMAKLLDTASTSAFFHIIDRDASERYVLVITDGQLQVFDFDGNEKTVNAPDGLGYISGLTDPADAIRALTVADYTFISNRTVAVAMDETSTTETRHPEALINITAGNYARTYEIRINGQVAASHATPDGTQTAHYAQIATTFIASKLYDKLVAAGYNDGETWGTGIHQNALHIVRWDDEPFTIAMSDGDNGNSSQLAQTVVQKFSALPNYAPQDFTIEVGNSEGTSFDNYWVKADKGGSDNNSRVTWREVVKPGTVTEIDASTMPHVLVREADGTFTFKVATWDKRKCGDGSTISPDPSFVGRTIEDIVFHRNRLGFLTDENTVFSRSGSFFDFFRTSATTVLDDDPIDVAASHIKVSLLKHAVPHQDYLLLFSSQTQFRLAGNELLTPKTVSIRPLTEYTCSTRVKPVAAGPSVFFVSDSHTETGNPEAHAQVYEYTLDKSLETANADRVTAHCPAYIPAGVSQIASSTDEDMLVLLTAGRPGSLFVYRYYWVNQEKLQSSWSEWPIEGAHLLAAKFIGEALVLIVARSDGVYLERIRIEASAHDSGFGFMVCLDQRATDQQLAAPTFNDQTNRTVYTLPYPTPETLLAVTAPGGSGAVGTELTVMDRGTYTVSLRGDTRGHRILFGAPYVSRYRFSTFYPRTPTPAGGTLARQDGRLQVVRLSLSYDKSAYFRVKVGTEGRDPSSYEFGGYVIGSPRAIVGSVVREGGRFNVPVASRNDRCTIDIINDTWLPSAFLSATWRGVWNPKSVRD